jgi:hypothetical protein
MVASAIAAYILNKVAPAKALAKLERYFARDPKRRSADGFDPAQLTKSDQRLATNAAGLYARANRRDDALYFVERAMELGADKTALRGDADLASLRTDPEFVRLTS